MQRRFLRVLAIALLLELAAYGQSLGDIARENREKQNPGAGSTKQPAVITNDDLGKEPGDDSKLPARTTSNKADHRPAVEQHPVDQRVAAQWKKQILAQKDKMLTLQARIDQLSALIRPPGTAQFEGPPNRYQTKLLERQAEIQLQLDEEKRKLTEMQEEARRAGMHTAVYDP
jgi:hypothetical protein